MEPSVTQFAHLKIPLEEILEATDNFADKNIIGKGGFGNVYKGKLIRNWETIKIAARRLGRDHRHGEVEFWNEISILSSPDLPYGVAVPLIGYCDEKREKILIYDHFPKGSLLMYLSNPTTFSWKQRLDMSINVSGIIRNMHYQRDSYYIIHRNISSFTIVLDKNMYPHLSGFEHSIKHSVDRRNQVFLCEEAIGTRGYMDPATENTGGVTLNSDIYSLGIVLFEMLCGRKANEDNKPLLGPLAKFHYENGTLEEIIHPPLWEQMKPESFKCFSEAAYSCLHEDRTQRPHVDQLLSKLNEAYNLQHDIVEPPAETNFPHELFNGFLHGHKKDHHIDFFQAEESDHENGTMSEEEEVERTEEFFGIFGGLIDYVASFSLYSQKVKSLERWRISALDILLPTKHFFDMSSRTFEGHSDAIFKLDLTCSDREYILSVEGTSKEKIPKKKYITMIKGIIVSEKQHQSYGKDHLLLELEILSICNHNNIESFLGFAEVSDDYLLLVSEFVSTKYLSSCLNDHVLTWEKRLKICIEVGRGLNYLHNEMADQKKVIHRAIRSKNIVLDDNWSPKIVEFGLAVFLPSNQDDNALYLNVIGDTNLYMDPEYVETGKLKRESDVFSFGVVMFEILCGMLVDDILENEGCNDKDLAYLAQRWSHEGIIKSKVNPIIKGEYYEKNFLLNKGPSEDSLDTFIKIMYQCVAPKQNERPTMKLIIEELEKALLFHENKLDTMRISYPDIELATQKFSRANYLGGGGFGGVFKGELGHGDSNGRNIIVAKKLEKTQGQGYKQFYNELQILYEYKHENIIDLVGYSNETDEKIIVYEYASNGSLDKRLDNVRLTWRSRLKICIDVAAGLDFLHGGVGGQEVVLHRDIKSANILLLEDWRAKLGDFGLSLISTINKDSHYAIDHACGTKGYVDPLYLKSGLLTIESDIYSFGVVLFEILCGRAIYTIPNYVSLDLLSFIKHNFEEGKQDDMTFKAIKEEIVSKSLSAFLNIIYKCLDADSEKRPTSKEVLTQLKNALKFQDEDEL